MTKKEEAIKLIKLHTLYEGDEEHLNEYYTDFLYSKKHALISVNFILSLCWNGNKKAEEYWQEVKIEIEKMQCP